MPTPDDQIRRRGLSPGWAVRARVIIVCLLACATLGLTPTVGSAHSLSTTAVLLDVGTDQVRGQVQLPIDRLAIALSRPVLTTAAAASEPAELEAIRTYVADHTAITDPATGTAWRVAVTGGRVETIDDVDHLVFGLTLTPPDGRVSNFSLHYAGIVEHLLSHRVFVSTRPAGAEAYTAVGVIDWESQTLTVPAAPPTPAHGFLAALRLGNHHIAKGADHLLFLLMLLLPAPLLARQGRWVRTDDLRRQCRRIVHVVTAFAIGHSITSLSAPSATSRCPPASSSA